MIDEQEISTGLEDLQTKMLMQMAAKIGELCEEQAKTREILADLQKIEDRLLRIMRQAYPGEDPDGHRRYHEEVIEEVKQRKEFWKKMLFELTKYGLLGFVGWLFVQVWSGALKGPIN